MLKIWAAVCSPSGTRWCWAAPFVFVTSRLAVVVDSTSSTFFSLPSRSLTNLRTESVLWDALCSVSIVYLLSQPTCAVDEWRLRACSSLTLCGRLLRVCSRAYSSDDYASACTDRSRRGAIFTHKLLRLSVTTRGVCHAVRYVYRESARRNSQCRAVCKRQDLYKYLMCRRLLCRFDPTDRCVDQEYDSK